MPAFEEPSAGEEASAGVEFEVADGPEFEADGLLAVAVALAAHVGGAEGSWVGANLACSADFVSPASHNDLSATPVTNVHESPFTRMIACAYWLMRGWVLMFVRIILNCTNPSMWGGKLCTCHSSGGSPNVAADMGTFRFVYCEPAVI